MTHTINPHSRHGAIIAVGEVVHALSIITGSHERYVSEMQVHSPIKLETIKITTS